MFSSLWGRCAASLFVLALLVGASSVGAQGVFDRRVVIDNVDRPATSQFTVQMPAGTPTGTTIYWKLDRAIGTGSPTITTVTDNAGVASTSGIGTVASNENAVVSACNRDPSSQTGGPPLEPPACAVIRYLGCTTQPSRLVSTGATVGQSVALTSSYSSNVLSDSVPRSGVRVNFRVVAGGGTLSSSSTVSGADGLASVSFTPGPSIGNQQVAANYSGPGTCAGESWTVNIDVAAAAGNVAPTAEFTSPAAGTSITAGNALPISIVARDSDGNVSRVVLTATNAAGAVVAPFPITIPGPDGETNNDFSYTWANAPEGTYTLSAIATDNNGAQSVATTRTVVVTPPACTPITFTAVSGNNQTAEVSTRLPLPYVVQISNISLPSDAVGRKAFNPGNSGATVVFTTTDGTVTAASVNVNAQDQASTFHRLGAVAGAQTVRATVSGPQLCPVAPVVFSATATEAELAEPTLTLTLPATNIETDVGKPVTIQATIANPRGAIRNVRAVIVNQTTGAVQPDVELTLLSARAYRATWTPTAPASTAPVTYRVLVKALDSVFGELSTTARAVTVNPPPRSVSSLVIESKSSLQSKPNVPITVVVTASDTQGGIPDQVLRWSAARVPGASPVAGSVCVERDTSGDVTTQASGIARITFTPCSADDYQFTVTALLNGAPTSISEGAVIKGVKSSAVPLATSLVRLAGKSVVVLPNKPFEVIVNTADANNVGLADVPLSWELQPPTSGTVTPPTMQTTATGDAKALITLSPTAKSTFLKICVTGTTNCVSFVLKNAITEVAEPAGAVAAPISNSAVASSRLQVGQIRTRFQQLRNEQSGGFSNGVGVSTSGLRVPLPTGESKPASSEGDGKPGTGETATGAGSTEREVSADGIKGSRWGVFTLGDIDVSRVSGGVRSDSGNGYDVSTQGLTIGVDYRLRPSVVIGMALGGLRGKVEAAANSQQRATGFSGSLFAQWFAPGQFYVNAVTNYGKNSYDLSRFATDAKRIDSSTDSKQQAFQLEGGYNYTNGSISASPYLRFEHVRAAIDGINESAANADAISTTPSKLRANTFAFGLQADTKFSTRNGVWIPGVRVEYLREKQSQSDSFAQLVNGTPLVIGDGPTTVRVPVAPFDSSYGNIGLSLQWLTGLGAQPISVFFGFDTTFGQSGVSTRRYSTGIKVPL